MIPKFRAFWKGKMYEVVEIDFKRGKVGVDLGDGGILRPWIEEVELMQYTGLADKNGREICMGDVMEDTDWGKGVVVYDEVNAQWILDCDVDYTALRFTKMEVIGNRFENPTLLPA